MNSMKLYKAIGEISDDFIREANPPGAKRRKISKIVILAAAMTALLGLSVWASGSLVAMREGHSSNIPKYRSVPSAERIQKDIGIAPHLVRRFSNGYTFSSAVISHDTDYDEGGSVLETYKALVCKYTSGSENISLYIDPASAGVQMDDCADVYRGAQIKYTSYDNKIVPGDYELTPQDEEDKRSGKYVFSFGGDFEIYHVQLTAFEYGGLNYSICAMNSTLSEYDMLQMAREIIDEQAKNNSEVSK